METAPRTILLVEDEVIIALTEKRWLKNEGFNVIHVVSGEKAIETVRNGSEEIALILMDINLGHGIDGTEAAQEILKTHDIPILFLSSHTEKDIVNRTEQITSYGYVVKDSTQTVLLASINMAFKLYYANQKVKAHEDVLMRQEFWLRESQKAARIGNYSIDIATGVWSASPTIDEIFGIGPDYYKDLEGWIKLIHPEEQEKLLAYYYEVINERSFFNMEYRIIRPSDGKMFWVHGIGRLIPDEAGNVVTMLGTIQDITERKKIDKSLRKSEEEYRRLFENAMMGIFHSLPDGKFLKVNPALARMLGYASPQEMVEMVTDISKQIYVDSKKRSAIYKNVVNTDGWVYAENIYRRKDGSLMTANLAVRKELNPDGTVAYLEGIVEDTTERGQSEQALRESKKQLQRVIEGSNNIYWDIDLTTGEVVYSGPIDQLWPFAPDELKTKKFTLNETMEFYHPDDRERVGAQIKDTLEGRAPVFDSEYRVLSKSGEWIWMHARGRIVKRDGAGRPLFASGTMTDITERKKAEEEVKKANDKLEELNATKDKLFSILAHDLRGPFSGFIGVTEELMRSLDALTKEEIATYAAVLHNTAKKTLELLTNLLEWSRLQAGKVDFRHGEYYLFLEVENIRNLLSSMAKNKSIDIINEVTEDMIVYADLHVLSTVLRNLISNSIKFTPQGGKIFVRSELANGSIKITVADTGIGMTEETMEKVFRVDSGYTTLGTNGEEGSGLGLVLCKDLVEKSGGTILVASIPGKGTNFIFTLPAAKA